ncbi:MAG: EamA family transporter [Hyphomicrobiaceae bacterium]
MDHLWIFISVFAALMQAVRTAAQKTLNQRMSNLGTTYVRSLVGLPIMLVYLAGVLVFSGGGLPPLSGAFLLHTFLGAAAQVLATMLLIHLFRLRNFAVGSMLIKVDLVMTALIGLVAFSESISGPGWLALAIVVAGVLAMSVGKMGVAKLAGDGSLLSSLTNEATRVALACALLFALSYLFLREATLALKPGDFLWRGAWTVVVATTMQVVCVGAWVIWKEPRVFLEIWPNRRIIGFIGLTSALGSIGWFTGFALQNASYVRAVGQIEAVFTVIISVLYFRERITRLELAGIALTVIGVLMFRLL